MKEKPQVRAVQLAGWILWDGVGESRLLRLVRAIPHRTPLGLSLSRSATMTLAVKFEHNAIRSCR